MGTLSVHDDQASPPWPHLDVRFVEMFNHQNLVAEEVSAQKRLDAPGFVSHIWRSCVIHAHEVAKGEAEQVSSHCLWAQSVECLLDSLNTLELIQIFVVIHEADVLNVPRLVHAVAARFASILQRRED